MTPVNAPFTIVLRNGVSDYPGAPCWFVDPWGRKAECSKEVYSYQDSANMIHLCKDGAAAEHEFTHLLCERITGHVCRDGCRLYGL